MAQTIPKLPVAERLKHWETLTETEQVDTSLEMMSWLIDSPESVDKKRVMERVDDLLDHRLALVERGRS